MGLYPLLLLMVSPLHCLSSSFPSSCGPGRSWAVRLNAASVKAGHSLDRLAQNVAEDVGLENHGQIGQLEGHYLLCQGLEDTANADPRSTKSALEENPHVVWHSQEHILRRSKRSVTFNDPKYPSQWHLVSDERHLSQFKHHDWLEALRFQPSDLSVFAFTAQRCEAGDGHQRDRRLGAEHHRRRGHGGCRG